MTIELIKKILDNDNLTIKDLEDIAAFVAKEIDIIEGAVKEANSPLSKTTCDEHMTLVRQYCELNKIYEQIIHTKYERNN